MEVDSIAQTHLGGALLEPPRLGTIPRIRKAHIVGKAGERLEQFTDALLAQHPTDEEDRTRSVSGLSIQ